MNNIKTQIISELKKAEEKSVSGEYLGEKLGISRTMVSRYIKKIRDDGYEVESSPKRGYTLKSVPQKMYPEEIKDGLKTTLFGKKIYYYERAGSSNDIAKSIADTEEEGTVVVIEEQTGGRGRLGRSWSSPKGGIAFSILLKPKIALDAASRLTLTMGLCVAKTMQSYGINALIKWPNDVLIDGDKVCGILTEVEAEIDTVRFAIVGIGINANVNLNDIPEELRQNSTTIRNHLGRNINRVKFLQDLLYEMEQHYILFKTQPFCEILSEIVALSDTVGKDVKVVTPNRIIEGKAIGISRSGALILQKPNGSAEEIIAGRCVYVRKEN